MADDQGHPPAETTPPPPPPLADIRVKPSRPRGLNRIAIALVAGGGVALVLVLASNGLSQNGHGKPADTKESLSDPALPEMAQSSGVRSLPAGYDHLPPPPPTAIPQLGPPLPGDVAALAPGGGASAAVAPGTVTPPGQATAATPTEAEQARRSGLFFQIREPAKSSTAPASHADPFKVLAQAPVPAPDRMPPERSLFPGSVIAASLVTDINSEAPGPAIAQITQGALDSATGRTLLIPQGARLIGDYKSAARFGETRVTVRWSRLIMPDGREIALDLPALGPSGAAGLSGKVDNHFGELFGAAILGTLINVGVAATEQQPALTAGGLGVPTQSPVETATQQGVERTASTVTSRTVDRSLAIPPTIKAPAGTRIAVIVLQRLTL